jgi:hypothetical protein
VRELLRARRSTRVHGLTPSVKYNFVYLFQGRGPRILVMMFEPFLHIYICTYKQYWSRHSGESFISAASGGLEGRDLGGRKPPFWGVGRRGTDASPFRPIVGRLCCVVSHLGASGKWYVGGRAVHVCRARVKLDALVRFLG